MNDSCKLFHKVSQWTYGKLVSKFIDYNGTHIGMYQVNCSICGEKIMYYRNIRGR